MINDHIKEDKGITTEILLHVTAGQQLIQSNTLSLSTHSEYHTHCMHVRKAVEYQARCTTGPFKCYLTFFSWKVDTHTHTHTHPHNPNNVEQCTPFVTFFSGKSDCVVHITHFNIYQHAPVINTHVCQMHCLLCNCRLTHLETLQLIHKMSNTGMLFKKNQVSHKEH